MVQNQHGDNVTSTNSKEIDVSPDIGTHSNATATLDIMLHYI